jgi:phytol kinase
MDFSAWISENFSSWLPSILVVGIWLALVLGLAEWMNRRENIDPEIPRKIVHIGTGNVILWAWWLETPSALGILASLLFCGVTLLSYRYDLLPSVSGVGRRSWGTFFYALSIGLLIAFFWIQSLPHFAVIGVLCMTWGDGMAALIGRKYGIHGYDIWGMHKSLEGTLTMGIISFLMTIMVLIMVYPNFYTSIGIALVVAVIATALEAFSKFGLDNLTVPLGSAFAGWGIVSLLKFLSL